MKRTLFLGLAVCLLLGLGACGGKTTAYRDDVSVASLASTIDAQLGNTSMAEMKESYVSGAMQLDTSLFSEYIVKINAQGVNIDEYGIFKAPSQDDVSKVKEAIEGYLQLRLSSWMDAYMPEEKPKLESAKVTVSGQYVYYTILSDDARKAVNTEIESALKA